MKIDALNACVVYAKSTTSQVQKFKVYLCNSYTMASRAVQVLLPEPEGEGN